MTDCWQVNQLGEGDIKEELREKARFAKKTFKMSFIHEIFTENIPSKSDSIFGISTP